MHIGANQFSMDRKGCDPYLNVICLTERDKIVTYKIFTCVSIGSDDAIGYKDVIFADGFGRITDMVVGPDGYLYVLSSADKGTAVYKIKQK